MKVRSDLLGLALAGCLVAVLLPAQALGATGQLSLFDQGWRVQEREGKRVVEVQALVVNGSQLPVEYKVRFILESQEMPRIGPDLLSAKAAAPPAPAWSVVQTSIVPGGPLAPAAVEEASAALPYELLAPGKAYRFRAELVDAASGDVVASEAIRPAGGRFGASRARASAETVRPPAVRPGASSTAVGVPADRQLVAAHDTETSCGSGTMSGTHTAVRLNGMWSEWGSGKITLLTNPAGIMKLDYQYTSTGDSAANLVAQATATGSWRRYDGKVEPVTIASATANMTYAGDRQQDGHLVTRTNATATGTFTGTVGGKTWTGLLTITAGTQTLDLSSNTGSHSFEIQFTASK